MLNGVLFNIIKSVLLVGKFVFSVSCFVNCHNSVMGVVVVVSYEKLLSKRSRTNILITHNNGIHHITRCRGDQGGGISFFISYISLAIYTHIHLNTFHILSINNANTCGGNCVELCGHTFSYLARRFTLYI